MRRISKESDVWTIVRAALIQMGPGMHYNRIESHSTALGYPDVEYCYRGVVSQIELKFVNSLSERIVIRPSQILWFTERVKSGGEPLMITGIKRAESICGMATEQLIMLHYGDDVAKMRDSTASEALMTAKLVWVNEIDQIEFKKEIADPWCNKDELIKVGGRR